MGYLGGEPAADPKFVDAKIADDTAVRRWYRTGDRGRRHGDGIEVVGRLDIQLNLNGIRADPVEIENALRQHPAVRDAAVRTHADSQGGSYLVAYLVDRGGDERATPASLRTLLGGLLPQSHIPARFVHIDALPLTPSRKIDRQALEAPVTLEHGGLLPATTAERKYSSCSGKS